VTAEERKGRAAGELARGSLEAAEQYLTLAERGSALVLVTNGLVAQDPRSATVTGFPALTPHRELRPTDGIRADEHTF